MANTKFDVYPNKAGDYTWHLKPSNGQVTATAAESFPQSAAATDAAAPVKRPAAIANVVED